MPRIGLIGAGRIGVVHARAIASHPGSALRCVADALPDNAQRLAETHGVPVSGTDDILADPAIDAVLIATSTDTHADLIEAATQAGKAVLCEKPVDLSLARAKTCQRVAAATGQPVMVGFNRRFDPNFVALKAAADAGEVGKPEMLALTSFDPAPPPVSYVEVSGGLFRDMTIHDFDMAHFVMGRLPDTVSATGSCVVDPDIGAAGDIDMAVVTMTYADGAIAVIRNSRRAAYGYDQRVELLGSEGLLQAENVLESSVVKSTVTGVVSAKPTYFFLERYMAAYEAEWAAFVTAVTDGGPMPVKLDDGVEALRLAEAATRSLQTGAPVHLADVE